MNQIFQSTGCAAAVAARICKRAMAEHVQYSSSGDEKDLESDRQSPDGPEQTRAAAYGDTDLEASMRHRTPADVRCNESKFASVVKRNSRDLAICLGPKQKSLAQHVIRICDAPRPAMCP